MMFMLLALAVLLFSGVSFSSSVIYHAIDNSVAAFDYSLPSLWVVTDVEEELPSPLYDTHLVEASAIQHFSTNLKGYVSSYQIGFYYFDQDTMLESEERYVSGVRVSLRAKVPFTADYYKAMSYVIKEMNNA